MFSEAMFTRTARGSYAHPTVVDDKGEVTTDEYLVIFSSPPPYVRFTPELGSDGNEPSEPKWSGPHEVPALGAYVNVRINSIGKSCVVGYFVDNGYLGVLVSPVKPPPWYVKQNGYTPGHVYGVEIEPITTGRRKTTEKAG